MAESEEIGGTEIIEDEEFEMIAEDHTLGAVDSTAPLPRLMPELPNVTCPGVKGDENHVKG